MADAHEAPNADLEAPAVVATTWRELRLHAWATVATLYGRRPPTKPNGRTPDMQEDERQAFMRAELRLDEHGGERRVADVMGGDVRINDRLVAKILTQPDRTPYVPWAYFGPQHAVEVWKKETVSKSTGLREVRDYYLVPLINSKHDGFVVIVGEDRVLFNLYPFQASTADGNLRVGGACIHRTYPDAVLCSVDCCVNLLAERRAAGQLRDQNVRLVRDLHSARLAVKAADLEIERLCARLERAQQ